MAFCVAEFCKREGIGSVTCSVAGDNCGEYLAPLFGLGWRDHNRCRQSAAQPKKQLFTTSPRGKGTYGVAEVPMWMLDQDQGSLGIKMETIR
jgi:hypothetical protein